MRHQSLQSRLLIGVCLAAMSSYSWCAAQYAPENGAGYTPMAPPAGMPSAGASPSNIADPTAMRAPAQPTNPNGIPKSWPNAAASASAWSSPDAVTALPPISELKAVDNARILGHVGPEVILESDVAGVVNDIIEANKDRIPPDQLEATRELIIKKQMKNVIQGKLIYLDAKRTIPSENWPHVESQLEKAFFDEELGRLMKRNNAASRRELDAKLAAAGTSVERERRTFCERSLAQQWVRQQIKRDDEITYDQMVRYYRQNQKEFTKPARAKWEELMVRFSKHPSKAAAYDAIAQLGNRVVAGEPLAAVAKQASDGATAGDGGAWDWTTKGGLVCKELDHALFSLPPGQLGPIIEGPTGFHIVRVIAREDPAVTPFLDAQVEIREKIVKQRSEKQLQEYLANLEAKTPVSTIFDGDKPSREQQLSGRPQAPLR